VDTAIVLCDPVGPVGPNCPPWVSTKTPSKYTKVFAVLVSNHVSPFVEVSIVG
jgi:hypothetical protein